MMSVWVVAFIAVCVNVGFIQAQNLQSSFVACAAAGGGQPCVQAAKMWIQQCGSNPTQSQCNTQAIQKVVATCMASSNPPQYCSILNQADSGMMDCFKQGSTCADEIETCQSLYPNATSAISLCGKRKLCGPQPYRQNDMDCWCAIILDKEQVATECQCGLYTSCDIGIPFACPEVDSSIESLQGCHQMGDEFHVSDPVALCNDSALQALIAFTCFPLIVAVIGIYATIKSRQLFNLIRKRKEKKSQPGQDDDDVPMIEINSMSRTPSSRGRLNSDAFKRPGTADGYSIEFARLNYFVKVATKKPSPWQKMVPCELGTPTYKQLLHNMTGRLEQGKLTGIMGASGTGKTTLLNLISGRSKSGEFSGLRMINGQPLGLDVYSSFLASQGYVMQHDSFLENLTVKQNMIFEALIRIPDRTPITKKLDLVEALLGEVGLVEVADNKIGGITFPGISGGQRRRLSIAVELLRLPQILILDEPTSGLDSTSALKLIRLLSDLAKKNRTVVTTIHQPRPEIIDLFDNILLLGEGGTIIYLGPASEALNYLQEAGIPSDGCDNPGDFIIDAIGLDPEAEESSTVTKSVDLISHWQNSPRSKNIMDSVKQAMSDASSSPPITAPKKTKSSRFTQTWVIFARRLTLYYDTPSQWLPNLFTVFAVSIVVGIAFSYKDSNLDTRAYEVMMFLFVMASYCMMVPYLISTPIYFSERPHLRRSRDSNALSLISYVSACTLEETMSGIVNVLIVGVIGQSMAHLNPELCYVEFAFALLVTGVCAFQAFIMWISMTTDDLGIAYNVIFLMLGLGSIYGGVFVQYSHIPAFFRWAYFTSIQMLVYRGLVVNDLQCCHLTIDCAGYNYYLIHSLVVTLVWSNKGFRDYYISQKYPRWQLLLDVDGQDSQFWNQTLYEENPYYCFNSTLLSNYTSMYQDDGNLGRYYLNQLEFGQVPKDVSLWILLVLCYGLRVLAWMTYVFRERSARKLKERASGEINDLVREAQTSSLLEMA
eukprot:m.203681 g.203681  ORF g.203681 m.203681 type:complete len:996 (-) comp15767_c0_seq8:130-3117(-)